MRHPWRSRIRPRPAEAGVTLVELLVGLVISSLFVPLLWNVVRSTIVFSESTVWQVQLQRDLDRLTTLLNIEAEEACLFGTTGDPAAGCFPTASASCSTATQNELRLRVPLLNASGAPAGSAVIRYFRTGTDLLRTGPAVLASGRLNPSVTSSNQLVMRGVNGFTVTPASGCTRANLALTVTSVAGTSIPSTAVTLGPRDLSLQAGVQPFID